MSIPNPAPDLYDEEEWEMLSSFDEGEWTSTPEERAELKRHQELFRAADAAGKVGPVDYDKPYPWSKKSRPAESPPPLAGGGVTGDNPPQNETP